MTTHLELVGAGPTAIGIVDLLSRQPNHATLDALKKRRIMITC